MQRTPSPGVGGGSRQGPPAFLPSPSSSSSLPALPLPWCWARASCCSRSCPGSPPAAERGGGHGGVTSSLNRRFPTVLGTVSGASQPSPGLLLLFPPQPPNKHNTGEAPSIASSLPHRGKPRHRRTRGPHRQHDRGGAKPAGSTWVPNPRLTGVRFLLCPVSRPFPPCRSIARQRGTTLRLLTAHCFRAIALFPARPCRGTPRWP